MAAQAVLILALLASAAYGVYEVRRWSTPRTRDLIAPRQRALRAWGLFFLLAALAFWLGGTFLHPPRVTPETRRSPQARRAAARYLAYWTLTVILTVPLVPLALLDTRETLSRLAAERRQIKRDILPSEDSSSSP